MKSSSILWGVLVVFIFPGLVRAGASFEHTYHLRVFGAVESR